MQTIDGHRKRWPFSLGGYTAFARGGRVVDSIFAGDAARLVYVELTPRF